MSDDRIYLTLVLSDLKLYVVSLMSRNNLRYFHEHNPV